MNRKPSVNQGLSRREALQWLGAAGTGLSFVIFPDRLQTCEKPFTSRGPIRLGVIADLHGGLAPDADARLDVFLEAMRKAECDALVQLGDFAYPNEAHQHFPDRFNAAHPETIHVIGNHEFDFGLNRDACYQAWNIEHSWYARSVGGIKLIVLDGNETGSPDHKGGYPSYIGKRQQQWLERELAASKELVVVLSHQPLAGVASIDNATEIQDLLGRFRKKILVCLNGHSHVDSLVVEQGVAYLHINSASYYWVGGSVRMAPYRDPLFTMITIDPESRTVTLEPATSDWSGPTPEETGYFESDSAPPRAIVTPRIRPHRISATELNVMTWNIWGRRNLEPRYHSEGVTARQRAIEIIEGTGADIIALIETYGSAAPIANSLGYHYHTPSEDANLCLLSRYPFTETEPLVDLDPNSFIAATIAMPGGQSVRIHDIWLTSGGRHIVEIKNPELSDNQFTSGDDIRSDHLQQLLGHASFQGDLARSDDIPLIVAGDFNCVSHLDYTESTRAADLNFDRILPIRVSRMMEDTGFCDTYRTAHADVSAETLGYTWTTVGPEYRFESGQGFVPADDYPQPEYRDAYARIDYIYSRSSRLQIRDARTITCHPDHAERGFPWFPSDHAAVLTRFSLAKPKSR